MADLFADIEEVVCRYCAILIFALPGVEQQPVQTSIDAILSALLDQPIVQDGKHHE
jgi:hypothetical protein